MNGRLFYFYLTTLLCLIGLSARTLGQTITISSVNPTSVCGGSTISLSYVTSGTFAASNTFSVKLSYVISRTNGPDTTISLPVSSTQGTIIATAPSTVVSGASYSIKIISTNPVVISPAIPITLKAKPSAPGVSLSPLPYCLGQTTPLSATPTSGATLNWYGTNQTGGTPSNIATIPSTTAVSPYTYYVSQSLNGCESERAPLSVDVSKTPDPPLVTTPAPTCLGNSIVGFNASATEPNAVLHWWKDGSKQIPGPSTPSNTQSTVYYVSQEAKKCDGPTAAISVTIVSPPDSPPTLKGPAPVCVGAPVGSLTAITTNADYQLRWYSSSTSSAFITTTPTVNNTATTVYYARQATKEGCISTLASVTVTINSLPTAPSALTPDPFCLNRKTNRTLVASGQNLKWYDANGSLLPSAPSPPTDKVGNILYYVTQTDANGCTSATSTTVIAKINTVPSPPLVTIPQDYCAGQIAQPLSATGVNLKWYGTDSTSSFTVSTTPGTSAAFIGTKNYYVTQTVDGCASDTKSIPVRVKTTPSLPAVQDYSFCQNYAPVSLSATPTSGATLNWWGESASGGTRADIPPTVPNTVDKTYTYFVSQTLDGCESGLGSSAGRAKINVRVKTTPGTPGVSPISLCNNASSQALTASGTNLKWYDSADNLIGNNAPTPNTSSVGNQTYKVTQTSGEGCESSKASLTVIINPLPGVPGVTDLYYCQSQQDQPGQSVSALNANGQNLKWYYNNSLLSYAPTPFITQAGTQLYQVSQTVNNCEGSKADLRVNIITSAAPTIPKSLVTYCLNDNATSLVASGDNGGQLRWVDPYGRVTTNAPTPSTLNTNVTPGGDAFYVYQIGANGCYSPRSTIKVVVTTPPTLALIAPTAIVNLGQRAPLQLKFTSVGPYSYTITGGYTGTTRIDTTIAVLPRANTIYQVIGVANGCGIGLPGNPATAQVMVRVPTVSTGSLSSTTLCTGTSLSANFTTTGDFNTGNTFRIELVNAADTTKKYGVAATTNASPVAGTIPSTVPSGQYYVRVKADNPEIAIIGSNSPTPLIVRSVASATLTGSQTIYEGVPANLTLTFAGDGPWTATYADSLRTYPVTVTASPYFAEVRPTRTTTYRLVSATNSCGNGPVSGTATITVSPLLGVDDSPLDLLVKTYPVPTTTTLRIELNLPLVREPATLSLIDQNGRPILQQTTRSQLNELDLTAQPGGLYFLRIQVGDKQTIRKVLKE